MTIRQLRSEMSLAEFIEWYIYDEMTAIMTEVKSLDKHGKMPDAIVIAMTIEHQEKHDWIGRVDPNTINKKLA